MKSKILKFLNYKQLVCIASLFSIGITPFYVHASDADHAVVELKPTKEEFERLGRWAKKDFMSLVNDAIQGDDAGLYLIGYSYLTGRMGQAINVEKANSFFAMSASLGFPPALDQISLMYMNDKSDPFLAMVYRNLAASYGHPELIIPYHELRTKLLNLFGPSKGQRILAEIESIAEKKRDMIERNKKELKKPENSNSQFNKVLFSGNIVHNDILYTNEFWQWVAEGKKKHKAHE